MKSSRTVPPKIATFDKNCCFPLYFTSTKEKFGKQNELCNNYINVYYVDSKCGRFYHFKSYSHILILIPNKQIKQTNKQTNKQMVNNKQ